MEGITPITNQVILGVKAGRGFGFFEESFIIEASLNGHTLETDILQPENEILIGAELLWEAEKRVLKRLRTGNVPIKVECFSIVNGDKQEKVGYVLLSLRAAKTTPRNNNSSIPATWHSLLGVKTDFKNYSPSLLLSLCIEDMSVRDNIFVSKASNSDTQVSLKKYVSPALSNSDKILIGPRKSADSIFLLNVIIESARDLHLLADSHHDTVGEFVFSCIIMGSFQNGGAISRLSIVTLDAENKFEIKISSSLKNLRKYFQERELACIMIKSNGEDIAFCNIDGSCLIPTDDLQIFRAQFSPNNALTMRSRCYLTKAHNQDVSIFSAGSKPYIDTLVSLQYLCSDNIIGLGQGDAENCNMIHSSCESINFCTKISTNIENTSVCNAYTYPQKRQMHKEEWFALNIYVQGVLMNKISFVDKFAFRFHQSKAMVILRHHEEFSVDQANVWTPTPNISCSLILKGSLNNVQHELFTHKPSVELVANGNEECSLFAYGKIDISPILENQTDSSVLVGLKDNFHGECGMIKFLMKLEKVILETLCTMPISESDGFTAQKTAKELEEWKEQQQVLFMAELKEKERNHLDAVVEDWEKRQKEYEVALNSNVQHCTELAASLSRATDELRIKSQIIAQKEMELSQLQASLEIEYQSKIQEFREASRRMEDDFKLEISSLQTENKSLLDQIAIQEDENSQMHKMRKELEYELERLKRNSLTEDQTTNLLKELKLIQEKYEIAHCSKIFFKEQWARAVREIHIIKSKFREEMNMQIKSNKEELKFLGKMLPSSESDHHSRKTSSEYTKLRNTSSQSEIDKCPSNRDLNSFSCSTPRLQSPHMDKEDVSDTLQKSLIEERIQALVQERDSLLNTRTYALDHVLIMKLNKEIRDLLAESSHKFI